MIKSDRRTRFLKMYANIPLGAREEIVAVVDYEGDKYTLSYKDIYFNILDGELADRALKKMEMLDLIPKT